MTLNILNLWNNNDKAWLLTTVHEQGFSNSNCYISHLLTDKKKYFFLPNGKKKKKKLLCLVIHFLKYWMLRPEHIDHSSQRIWSDLHLLWDRRNKLLSDSERQHLDLRAVATFFVVQDSIENKLPSMFWLSSDKLLLIWGFKYQ